VLLLLLLLIPHDGKFPSMPSSRIELAAFVASNISHFIMCLANEMNGGVGWLDHHHRAAAIH